MPIFLKFRELWILNSLNIQSHKAKFQGLTTHNPGLKISRSIIKVFNSHATKSEGPMTQGPQALISLGYQGLMSHVLKMVRFSELAV